MQNPVVAFSVRRCSGSSSQSLDSFTLRPARESDIDDIVRFLLKDFVKRDALCTSSGLEDAEAEPLYRMITRSYFPNGSSYVMFSESNELVGVRLGEVIHRPGSGEFTKKEKKEEEGNAVKMSAKCQYIEKLLETIKEDISSRYSGHGLGGRLYAGNIPDGVQGVLSDKTNLASQTVRRGRGLRGKKLAGLFNEPLQVDWNSVLKPYHTDVLKAIRAIDPDNVALLGTPSYSGATGIIDASNSPLWGQKNIMYVQHFYSGSHRDNERNAYSRAAAKIPVFISEYGVSEADGGSNGQIYTDEANKWFSLLDRNKASYLAWSICDKNEAASALKPGTQPNQVGNDWQLSKAGVFLKNKIKSKKLFSCNARG